MKAMTVTVIMLGVLFLAGVAPAFAQTTQPPAQPGQTQPAQTPPAQGPQLQPSVAGIEPFSAAANFMSLVGYLRWVMFQQTSQWLSHLEAARIVGQQTGSQ
jgi:hypothetical protein